MGRLMLLCLFAYGCGTPEYRACEDMCKELGRTCAYAAFPTTDSCMQGCADELDNGADIFGKEECILDAECDTFAIVECQNSYGSEQ